MTRKDYTLIALALQDCKPAKSVSLAPSVSRQVRAAYKAELDQWQTTCHSIADALAHDNPAFDRARFLAACGL